MLASKTVLILGAGASLEYGFPSGKQLLDRICQVCQSPQFERQFEELLATQGDSAVHIARELARTIHNSPVLSIDLLLQYRTEFINVGKCAIAYVLVPMETPDRLTDINTRSACWYPYLFEQMRTSDLESFGGNRLTIVTFNYDRSIDAYLRIVLKNMFNADDTKIEAVMDRIPIIHLHGQLGNLGDNPYGRFLPGYAKYVEILQRAKDGIKIIHEIDNADNDPEFIKARAALNEAQDIVFLGFGYGAENLKRLKIKQHSDATIGGTAFGLSEPKLAEVRSIIRSRESIIFGKTYEEILPFLLRQSFLEKAP
jgi:hypothetical protein